ncbi:GNAT family N-acetyltransferase [Vibrio rotiferianus]|uniref:GNAT family N-acetyltransferase n=1 Tax=Vibrio rotiferianus TaxID=190895 RepID=UPI003397FDF0
MYKLVKFHQWDGITSGHTFRFSQWMKGSGVTPDEVFAICKVVIETQSEKCSMFAIVKPKEKEVIGYIVFLLGVNSRRYSRINFFALSPAMRNQGIGKEVLSWAIDELIMEVDATSVACKAQLVPFYKSCGFEHIGTTETGDELLIFSVLPLDLFDDLLNMQLVLVGYDGQFEEEYAALEATLLREPECQVLFE